METAPLLSPTSGASAEADAADRKTVLITGANGGLGLALAKQMAKAGWRVFLHGRRPEKLNAARLKVGRLGPHESFRADLSDLDAVRQLASDVREQTDRLDVLVNNAGLLMPKCRLTPQHIETTMAVNAVAPFVLFRELQPLLEATAREHGGARLVNVTSESHRGGRFKSSASGDLAEELREPERGYNSMKAYAQSKLALTAWTLEAARRLEGTGVVVHACHPGVVRTGIFPGLGGPNGFFATLFSFLYLPPRLGAKVPLALATAPDWGEVTGRFLKRTHLRGPFEAVPPEQGRAPEWTGAVWDAMEILARDA